jgi:hypothetical protein
MSMSFSAGLFMRTFLAFMPIRSLACDYRVPFIACIHRV